MIKALTTALALGMMTLAASGTARAETTMQQCGRQYQDAKAANTLNGMTWNQYRTDCAARLKASSGTAAATAAPAAPATAGTPTANPLNPAIPAAPGATPAPADTIAASTPTKPAPSGGRAAFLTRQKECGAEWRANKVTLLAQTPGLTWPKYLSQCNTRLKAAGK